MRGATLLLRSWLGAGLVLAVMSAASAPAASADVPYRGANVHSLQLWNVSAADMNRELDALHAAGANAVRVDVTWSALEPVSGQYCSCYLARMDAFMSGAHSRGLSVIATVAATPTWASPGGAWNDPPSDPAQFGAVARFITSRYRGDLAAVEALNEPNWDGNLKSADKPATYAVLLKAFYTGAKQGDPSVPVLLGGLRYADVPFLNALYAQGISGYYDGISLHPYADGADPSDTSVTHSFLGGIQQLHAAQQAAGDTTPIWVTEFGWPTGSFPGANTEQQSAGYIKEAFSILAGLSYVRAGIVYQLRDQATDLSNPEDNFGLLHQDFTPRPAFAAFQAAMQGGTSPSDSPSAANPPAASVPASQAGASSATATATATRSAASAPSAQPPPHRVKCPPKKHKKKRKKHKKHRPPKRHHR